MNDLAPLLQGFFSDRLIRQRQASPHTVCAYRDTITLLLGFVHQRTGRQPATLSIADLDPETVAAFLAHLETDRGNTPRPAIRGWPRSTPCSATPRCATLNTQR